MILMMKQKEEGDDNNDHSNNTANIHTPVVITITDNIDSNYF